MQSTSIKKIYSDISNTITGEKTKKLIIENIGNTYKDLIFYIPYKVVSSLYCDNWGQLLDKKKILIKVLVDKHYYSFRKSNIPYRIKVIFDNIPLEFKPLFSDEENTNNDNMYIDRPTYVMLNYTKTKNKNNIKHKIYENILYKVIDIKSTTSTHHYIFYIYYVYSSTSPTVFPSPREGQQ